MTVLIIQPGPANSIDTFIAEPAPNNNYKGSEYLIVQGIAPDRYHSLLQFSLALLPIGAAISSAKLYLFPDTLSGSKNIHLSEASQSWDIDTVTWNTRPVPGMKTITKKAVINTWLEFDILSIIQDWIATPAYNLGFQLVSDLCDNSEVVFYSGDYLADPTKRPYLEIIYTGGYLPNYGDVIGPGGATDSNLAEFDGPTGKLIKDSGFNHAQIVAIIALTHVQNTDTAVANLTITNAMVALAAAIVDTKLAEIGTANKVNGTAFKNLPGIPAGAGPIPAANLPAESVPALLDSCDDYTSWAADQGATVAASLAVWREGTQAISIVKAGAQTTPRVYKGWNAGSKNLTGYAVYCYLYIKNATILAQITSIRMYACSGTGISTSWWVDIPAANLVVGWNVLAIFPTNARSSKTGSPNITAMTYGVLQITCSATPLAAGDIIMDRWCYGSL